MEGLESLGINWKVLLGQIANFLILLFLLQKYVFPKFFQVLKERKEKIEEIIRKEEELDKKSEMLEAEAEEIINKTKEKAEAILKEAQEKAKEKEAEILGNAEKEKEKIIQEAKMLGEMEIQKLRNEFLKKNLRLVILLVEKMLAKKIDPKEDERLVLELLKKIENHEK